MLYKALTSFSGKVSMAVGEIKDLSDKAVIKDLLDAKYIEEVEAEKKRVKKKTPKGE